MSTEKVIPEKKIEGLLEALRQIVQMSDPGSAEKAVIDMKSIASKALRHSLTQSTETKGGVKWIDISDAFEKYRGDPKFQDPFHSFPEYLIKENYKLIQLDESTIDDNQAPINEVNEELAIRKIIAGEYGSDTEISFIVLAAEEIYQQFIEPLQKELATLKLDKAYREWQEDECRIPNDVLPGTAEGYGGKGYQQQPVTPEVIQEKWKKLMDTKIDYTDTEALAKDVWLFLTNDSMPKKATIKYEAFIHEVKAMIESAVLFNQKSTTPEVKEVTEDMVKHHIFIKTTLTEYRSSEAAKAIMQLFQPLQDELKQLREIKKEKDYDDLYRPGRGG